MFFFSRLFVIASIHFALLHSPMFLSCTILKMVRDHIVVMNRCTENIPHSSNNNNNVKTSSTAIHIWFYVMWWKSRLNGNAYLWIDLTIPIKCCTKFADLIYTELDFEWIRADENNVAITYLGLLYVWIGEIWHASVHQVNIFNGTDLFC